MLQTIETILVPVNFSETSGKVLATAKMLAQRCQSKIVVLHVGDLFPQAIEDFVQNIDFATVSEQARAKLQQQLEHYVAEHLVEWDSQAIVAMGEVHTQIIKVAQAQAADLIIMATHGRGGVTQAILGSNTERVLRGSPCPVLAIPV